MDVVSARLAGVNLLLFACLAEAVARFHREQASHGKFIHRTQTQKKTCFCIWDAFFLFQIPH